MSVKKLLRAIAVLPPKRRDIGHVTRLAEATGENVGGKEARVLDGLMQNEWRTFTRPALRALERLSGRAAPDRAPVAFELAKRFTTGIKEQSTLTFLGAELGFATVDDESSRVWRIGFPAGDKLAVEMLRDDDGAFEGVEGAVFDRRTSSLLLLSEGASELRTMRLSQADGNVVLGKSKRKGELERLGKKRNKGWEGLALWPPDDATKQWMLAVHEGSPKVIGIFDRETLRQEAILELPRSVDEALEDLSDLTVDPGTGHLFLLSDESRCIAELELCRSEKLLGAGPLAERWSLVPIGTTPLPAVPGVALKPEGLAFDHTGDLWIACEGATALLQLSRIAAAPA